MMALSPEIWIFLFFRLGKRPGVPGGTALAASQVVVPRRHARYPLEDLREVEGVLEADELGDLEHLVPPRRDEFLGFLDLDLRHEVGEADARVFLEKGREMVRRHVEA